MKSKNNMMFFAAGLTTALMMEQVRNGNMKKWFRKMKNMDLKAIDELENMMK